MKKNKWAKVAIAAIAVAVTFGAVSAISRSAGDEEKVLNGWAYETCRLNDTTGKADEEDKSGISTKDFYEIDQLQSIKLTVEDEEAESIEYYVNLYDEDKRFMSVEKQTGDFMAEDVAAAKARGAAYFKVEIVDTEDEKISFLEKFGLSDKVAVKLDMSEDVSEKGE